jgi:hypothetical protein
MSLCIDNLLFEFYIQLCIFMMPVNQQIYCVSPYPWDVPVEGYMEVNKINKCCNF